MKDIKLSAKQKCFAEEYMIDFNATQAAIRAGYSKKTAGQVGHELLEKPSVEAYIYALMAARITKIRAATDRALDELCEIAFTKDGTVKTSERLRALQTLPKYAEVFEKQAANQLARLKGEPDGTIVVPKLVIVPYEDSVVDERDGATSCDKTPENAA